MKLKFVLVFVILYLLVGCEWKARVEPLFQKMPIGETNIAFENTLVEEPVFNSINYLYFYDGGGVAVGDVNNDGLADIYLGANSGENRLYLNLGDFKFEDVTAKARVGGGTKGWTTGVNMVDVNGDGWLDIYVCISNVLDRAGANQLFINNGDGTFSEKAAEYGLDVRALSRHSAFFDYDLDGDLDLYLLKHSIHSKGTFSDQEKLHNQIDKESGDNLFRNDNGHFINVSAEAGIIQSVLGYGLGVAVGDVNWDGYPDIYISNDFHEDDYLYYNNGDGTFTENMRASMQHTSLASMGNDLADINNDGLLDLIVLDMLAEDEKIRKTAVTFDSYQVYNTKMGFGYYHQLRRNTLQLNRGFAPQKNDTKAQPALFSEIGQLSGVHATDWSWASLFMDFDNDGLKDLFVSNGIYHRPNDLDYLAAIKNSELQYVTNGGVPEEKKIPIEQAELDSVVKKMPSVPVANYAFHANGDLTFQNRAKEWGLGDLVFSSGSAYADLDNDGDLDLVVNNVNAPAGIYKNLLYENVKEGEAPPGYLKIKLAGKVPNQWGIGAKALIYADGKKMLQTQMPSRGFQSSVEPVLTIGLGNITQIDSLHFIWPDGKYQSLKNIAVNQTLTLRQEDADAGYIYRLQKSIAPLMQDVTDTFSISFTHRENTFIEFNRESFIPYFRSTEGPALAVADVNGDELEDVFIGGAKRQVGKLFLQNAQGEFSAIDDSIFRKDAVSEDDDAIFFDVNGDGAQDLYVVSGGNEFFGNTAKPLRDRFYLNDGSGNFRKSEDGLPADILANGACVKPADIDQDGDIDLFVGSRSIPWKYGASPKSYLLMNDGTGKFSDQTTEIAVDLSKIGMVTNAAWVDLNKDNAPDLVVVGEWMPISIFHNEGGKLVNVTEKYGLENTQGWWHSLTIGDFNGDGFIDFAAGNLGLNSILKASADKPLRMYVNDFSGNKRLDHIIAYEKDGGYYPLVDYAQLTLVIPALKKQLKKHADYAGKTIEKLFPKEILAQTTLFEAKTFASSLFLNNGDGSFEIRSLPVEAQFSPVYTMLTEDFNNDGNLDILSAGNQFGVKPEQGRYDADYGCLMLGDGKGNFSVQNLEKSGFTFTGEMRQLKLVRSATGEKYILAARNNDTLKVFRLTQ